MAIGVYDTVKQLLDGEFKWDTTTIYGLNEVAVGISHTTKNLVPQYILDYVNKEADKLKSREIKAPKNKQEYD